MHTRRAVAKCDFSQLDHLQLANHSRGRFTPVDIDVACWSTPATHAIPSGARERPETILRHDRSRI